MSQSWGGLLGRDVIYLMPIDNLENWGGVEYDKIESVGLYGNTYVDGEGTGTAGSKEPGD